MVQGWTFTVIDDFLFQAIWQNNYIAIKDQVGVVFFLNLLLSCPLCLHIAMTQHPIAEGFGVPVFCQMAWGKPPTNILQNSPIEEGGLLKIL